MVALMIPVAFARSAAGILGSSRLHREMKSKRPDIAFRNTNKNENGA